METFFRGIWRIFRVLEASGILMNHLWDFPGLLDRARLFWDLGVKIYFDEKHKIDFQVTLGHQKPKTKN
jgi:hypothetical protein